MQTRRVNSFPGRAAASLIILASLQAPLTPVEAQVVPKTPTLAARQQAKADSGLVVVKGVVVDSLHGGYLEGAIISVSGTPRMAITDSNGRFRIDGIPPGTGRIEVYHDALDELGLSLVTPQMDLRPSDSMAVVLAFPSAATVVKALCRAPERAAGPAAVLGQVIDAENQKPLAGARVSVEWFEFVANKNKIGTSHQHRDATSLSDGHFRICGLPSEGSAGLKASFGSDTTAVIPVRFDAIVGVATLRLAPGYAGVNDVSASDSAVATKARSTRAAGTITGRVVNPNGGPLSGARVAVDRPAMVTQTSADGRFALQGIRPGTRNLYVRRIGYQPFEAPVNVSAGPPANLTVQLAEFVPMLDTVVVTAMLRDVGLERVGFSKRKKTGMGTYLGPEQIEKQHAFRFVDFFATVPMLRRSTSEDGRSILVGRPNGFGSGCVNYFVDNVPWIGGGIEEFIIPEEVGAIEVYSFASTPGQFRRPGNACETVVVWTKLRLRYF